jgi:hypothetical protein
MSTTQSFLSYITYDNLQGPPTPSNVILKN